MNLFPEMPPDDGFQVAPERSVSAKFSDVLDLAEIVLIFGPKRFSKTCLPFNLYNQKVRKHGTV